MEIAVYNWRWRMMRREKTTIYFFCDIVAKCSFKQKLLFFLLLSPLICTDLNFELFFLSAGFPRRLALTFNRRLAGSCRIKACLAAKKFLFSLIYGLKEVPLSSVVLLPGLTLSSLYAHTHSVHTHTHTLSQAVSADGIQSGNS